MSLNNEELANVIGRCSMACDETKKCESIDCRKCCLIRDVDTWNLIEKPDSNIFLETVFENL